MRTSKPRTTRQNPPPQTAEERAAQLKRIADLILYRIERGACLPSERTQLLRQYDLIDRMLQRHNAGGDVESPLLTALMELERKRA